MRSILSGIIFFIGLFVVNELNAQDTLSRKEANSQRPKYLELSYGLGYSYYRDFATGPLFYTGLAQNGAIHYHRFDQEKESRFGARFIGGNYSFEIGNERARSSLYHLSLDFGKLWRVDRISNDKYHIKAGGLLLLSGNMRNDPSLQNASFGYELIYNLMASAKVSRDVSRTTAKSWKLWFINWKWEPRRRLLSYRLNVGLINAHLRNAYPYVNQAQLVNESPVFVDYENSFFQGFRMLSDLNYTIYLHNGNAVRISYIWDAYTSGQVDVPLEMASHIMSFSLLFNLK